MELIKKIEQKTGARLIPLTIDEIYGNDPQTHLPFIVEESMIYKPLYDSIKSAAFIIGIILVFFSFVYIFMRLRR